MRYQQPIYIQNDNSAVRNKDILNVNMSSDMFVFEAPKFTVIGASKLNCSGGTPSYYAVSSATTIPLSFYFTGNTDTFTASSANFKYEIYKFNNNVDKFTLPPVYKSDIFSYVSFSGTNTINESVPISSLSLDGDYLVKGYFQFSASTTFLNKLGITVDTSVYKNGSQYNIYNKDLDFYFIAFKEADVPIFVNNGTASPFPNKLFQQNIIAESGQTIMTISSGYDGYFIVSVNGDILTPDNDYTFTGNVVSFNSALSSGDVVSFTYTTLNGSNHLKGDNIDITKTIVSGATGDQGDEIVFFNTGTSKYEIYTSVTPIANNDILVALNGMLLVNNIDYYQSISNPKRIILEGSLIVGDLLTIVYFPITSLVDGITISNPVVSWTIPNAPQKDNGEFTLEVSYDSGFTSTIYSNSQQYVVGKSLYEDSFIASGSVDTKIYYRVKNEKNYESVCGNLIGSTAYSETINVTIISNAINSY